MEIVSEHGRDDVAKVYVGSFGPRKRVEFVESLQSPIPREEKWVLIVSSLFGCPIDCAMCDAGGDFRGRLSASEILAQTDFMVRRRYPDGRVPTRKFKVQFARMGEPALNPAVLEALEALPSRYGAPELLACVSTIAPSCGVSFFDGLLDVKERYYPAGRFQLQFSVHSTDAAERDRLMPAPKWGLSEIASYGELWFKPGDRKVTLNFAPARGGSLDPDVIASRFDPRKFLVKLTPLNPTRKVSAGGMRSMLDPAAPAGVGGTVEALRQSGFDVLVSIGDLEENRIGSNCGMYLGSEEL